MRPEPSLTFEGALKILGHYEPTWIERLNNVLGGVIFGAGAAAGLAAIGPAVLAPLGMFAAVWGWMGNKDTAVELLRQAVGAVSGKLAGTSGYERRQLIAAAHTTIVVASFFEVLEEEIGAKSFGRLRITDSEKAALANVQKDTASGTIFEILYRTEVPAPSAVSGFEENVPALGQWYILFAQHLATFIHDVTGEKLDIRWSDVARKARERYESRYLALAATVPEFMVWAMLGEHAATRVAVASLRADVVAVLDGERDSLSRVEALLALGTGPVPMSARPGTGPSDLRARVARANRGVLTEKIIPEDARSYGADISFPTVDQGYINPRFRIDLARAIALPADEGWWSGLPERDDFDLMFAGYVASPYATQVPMLLLGDPGAGKSMLAKVLAARLPAAGYTVVRVPLRQVRADAPVTSQIEDALRRSTNQPIAWWNLADQSQDTVLVVLLDGLDELLQASVHDRSGYLHDVAEFQKGEALQDRPVIVVVTSRTVVVDRVRIPDGTTLVKLGSFTDDDVADWLGRWRRVNAEAIAGQRMGDLTLAAARTQPVLAGQPLLLLMLALYAADLTMPPLDAGLGRAELYQRLLDGFARREAAKDLGLGHDPRPDELESRARDHLKRLEIAALAMFNRGRQDIGEEDLGKDVEALDPRLMVRPRPVEAGQRIIGEFFFVHAAEARALTGTANMQDVRALLPRRSYEFLHATFGEYPVARQVMDELADVAEKAFSERRGPGEPDDDLLFALLSHQVLVARRSTLDFAIEIFADLPGQLRPHMLRTLEMLTSTYRNRHDSARFTAYRPTPPDQVHQLACYCANLVTLRVSMEPEGGTVPLENLLGDIGTMTLWRSTVRFWEAGLDHDSMQAILNSIARVETNSLLDIREPVPSKGRPEEGYEIARAQLIDDSQLECRLRYGAAIVDGYQYYNHDEPGTWADMMSSWLIAANAMKVNFQPADFMLTSPPEGTGIQDITTVARLLLILLESGRYPIKLDSRVFRLVSSLLPYLRDERLSLARLVLANTRLRREIPELGNLDIYGHYAELVRKAREPADPQELDFGKLPVEVIVAIQSILAGEQRTPALLPACWRPCRWPEWSVSGLIVRPMTAVWPRMVVAILPSNISRVRWVQSARSGSPRRWTRRSACCVSGPFGFRTRDYGEPIVVG